MPLGQAARIVGRYGNLPTPHGTGTDGHSSPLGRAARHWPTPKAADSEVRGAVPDRYPARGNLDENPTPPAPAPPGLWPTPRASEWKGTGPIGSASHEYRVDRHYLDATVQEAEHASGPLNPTWVEWLMGFPIGYTDLEVDEPTDLEGEPWPIDPATYGFVPRLARGVVRRKYRLQQLGNAVVPKVAMVVGLRMLDLLGQAEEE